MRSGIRSCVAVAAIAGTGLVASPRAARACCGVYVASHDQPLANDATQVVLMRKGTRTVVAIQSDYKGPADAFALIIPVPATLREQDVKTLPSDLFRHVEQVGAPRLVEYWEQDPCAPEAAYETPAVSPSSSDKPDDDVKRDAPFVVGEYQIQIVAPKDWAAFDAWLHQEKYALPQGVEPLLRPYIERGMKFLVAKVDPKKLTLVDNRATLSPLRFHFDSDELSLPIQLGSAAGTGTQDLIVNILAPGQRYEAANASNVTIPTNLDVRPVVKSSFGAFYAAVFDRATAHAKGATVTEYAAPATTCDPCSAPALSPAELQALGADVLLGPRDQPQRYDGSDFVLTRLHVRTDAANDLVFAPAQPIAGGGEIAGPSGGLDQEAHADRDNRFQARYAIRHPWQGPIRCSNPRHGTWDGPPIEIARAPGFQAMGTMPALGLAYVPRDQVKLASAVVRDVPALGIKAGTADTDEPPPAPPQVQVGSGSGSQAATKEKRKTGCGCEATGVGDASSAGLIVVVGALVRRRRRAR